jgi:signal transduction histidine kinase
MARFLRRRVVDVLIVAAAAAAVLEVTLGGDELHAPQTTLWFTVPAVVLVALPLLLRRRYPFGAPAALWLLAAAVAFVDGHLITFARGVFLAGLAAAFLLGNLRDPRQQRAGLVLVVASVALIVYEEPEHSTGELLFTPVLFAIAWLVGFALHEADARTAQATREREVAARVAVAEERARIARELHDIVAHSVSVMVLQVGAVRHNLADGPDRDALRDVERTGRAALAEMRRLLGAMRRDGDELELTPQPGLGSLEPLLDETRRSGLPVELHVEGEPVPLPDAIDLSAYRIVQEGLTNARKHAHASRADVLVRYGAGDVRIEVRDNGRGPSRSDGHGHGLVGVRERVNLYGGEMSAGRAPEGGFLLSTRLPIGA